MPARSSPTACLRTRRVASTACGTWRARGTGSPRRRARSAASRRTRARLLVFLNLNCGSCISLRAELPAFAEANPEVAVHPVYHSGVEVAAIPEGLDWLLDPDGGVSRTFDFFVTPSAILLGTDGLLAGGPVEGADNVLDLLAGVSEELAAARA